MHSAKKDKSWHSGKKMNIGMDKATGIFHTDVTPCLMSTMCNDGGIRRSEDDEVIRDSCYLSMEKC